MSRVEDLLRRYVAEHREHGDADPLPYLEQVEGTDRAELAALIDGFLDQAPPPPFDPAAFAAFRADPRRQAMVDRLLDDEPAIADLRAAAGATRGRIAREIAAALGFPGREEAVKGCYHELETGRVDPGRVRPPVWQALARILGEPAEALRAAAERAFASRSGGAAEVFARTPSAAPAPAAARPRKAARPDPDADVRRAFFDDP